MWRVVTDLPEAVYLQPIIRRNVASLIGANSTWRLLLVDDQSHDYSDKRLGAYGMCMVKDFTFVLIEFSNLHITSVA